MRRVEYNIDPQRHTKQNSHRNEDTKINEINLFVIKERHASPVMARNYGKSKISEEFNHISTSIRKRSDL